MTIRPPTKSLIDYLPRPHGATLQDRRCQPADRTLGRSLTYYEGATELALDSQPYAFALRLAHPLLSTQDGRDEEHFAWAEELRRVMKLEPSFDQLRGADLSPNAQLALGDLYKAWERRKDATTHEEALKLNLSLQEAKRKLEETRQE